MGKVVALDRGCSEQTLVIWRDGRLLGWTWRMTVREAAAVLAEWRDPANRRWLRVQDRQGAVFLLGETPAGWVAVAWPPAGPGAVPAGMGTLGLASRAGSPVS